MILTRRGFLFSAGAVAIASGAMPLAKAIEWVEAEAPKVEVVKYLGRFVRVAGSGIMGDGLVVAAPGKRVEAWRISGGVYDVTLYPRSSLREALDMLGAGAETIYVPDFAKRRNEVRSIAMEDRELAGMLEFAQASFSGRRRIILS